MMTFPELVAFPRLIAEMAVEPVRSMLDTLRAQDSGRCRRKECSDRVVLPGLPCMATTTARWDAKRTARSASKAPMWTFFALLGVRVCTGEKKSLYVLVVVII